MKQGVELSIHKIIPGFRGMGSSAASAVAGAFAVNALFEGNLLEAGPPPSRRERGVARLRRLLSGQCQSVAVGIIVTNPFSKHTVSLGTIPSACTSSS